MRSKSFYVIAILALLSIAFAAGGYTRSVPAATASTLTGYYTIFGYEGIGTYGSSLGSHGGAPQVGDYATTHCRYINVANTAIGDYYLRYPLHLPNGATISSVSLHVADYNPSGVMWIYLRSRPWNSRDAGTTVSFTLTDNTTNSDKTVSITGINKKVDNSTTEYWIDVTPVNGADPGLLMPLLAGAYPHRGRPAKDALFFWGCAMFTAAPDSGCRCSGSRKAPHSAGCRLHLAPHRIPASRRPLRRGTDGFG